VNLPWLLLQPQQEFAGQSLAQRNAATDQVQQKEKAAGSSAFSGGRGAMAGTINGREVERV